MWDWLDEIINIGANAGDVGGDAATTLLTDVGDFGGDAGQWFLDTATGEVVSAAEMQQIMDLDLSGSMGSDFTGSLDFSPSSVSTSDYLRSLQADPHTPGSEPFDWSKMADPSASIASASQGSSGWAKALAQGLGSALGGLGAPLKGLAGLGGDARGVSTPGLGAMMSGAGSGGLGGVGDGGGSASLRDGGRLGGADGISAGLLRDQAQAAWLRGLADPHGLADPGLKFAMQAPIDPGPAPVKFTPLQLPPSSPPAASLPAAGLPRMSGLQRLLAERLG